MKPFALLLLLLMALPSAAAQADPDPRLDAALNYSRARIGQPDRHGWTLVEARIEGNTLVLAFTPPAAGTGGASVDEYAASVASGLCQPPNDGGFFADGRGLRVEIRGSGETGGSTMIRACPDRAEATRILARNIQRRAGMRVGAATIAGARAEGTELVILIDGAPGWRRGLSAERLNAALFSSYCRNPDTRFYFDGTRTVRFDSMENGSDVRRGLPIASCAPYTAR